MNFEIISRHLDGGFMNVMTRFEGMAKWNKFVLPSRNRSDSKILTVWQSSGKIVHKSETEISLAIISLKNTRWSDIYKYVDFKKWPSNIIRLDFKNEFWNYIFDSIIDYILKSITNNDRPSILLKKDLENIYCIGVIFPPKTKTECIRIRE